jgi:hypothetical protein
LLASIAERRASSLPSPASSRSSSGSADEEDGGDDIEGGGVATIFEEAVVHVEEEEEGTFLTEDVVADDKVDDMDKVEPALLPARPQPVKPVLCSWGSGGSGGLLHEDCSDRDLLPLHIATAMTPMLLSPPKFLVAPSRPTMLPSPPPSRRPR